MEDEVGRLAPTVRTQRARPRCPRAQGDLVEAEHAEGRNQVLAEVLVLVVAEDDDEVGRELVERPPTAAKAGDEPLTVAGRCCRTLVVGELGAHLRGPGRAILEVGAHSRSALEHTQQVRHALVAPGKRRIVRQAES